MSSGAKIFCASPSSQASRSWPRASPSDASQAPHRLPVGAAKFFNRPKLNEVIMLERSSTSPKKLNAGTQLKKNNANSMCGMN